MKNTTLLPVLLCAGLLFNGLDSLLGPNEAKADVCFYVQMYDSFGDGWNGGSYTIYNWNYNFIGSGTLETGSYDFDYYCVPDGCYYIYVSGGDFPSEISWDIYTSGVISSGGAPVNAQQFYLGFVTGGCTDPWACNYSAFATCDDGSCCYGHCILIEMQDSYGDGWNGAYMSITDNTGLFYFGNTFSSGLSAVFYECLPTGCYNVSVTAGDFPSEISWNIYTYDNYYGTIELLVSGSGASIAHFGAGGDCQGLGCVNPVACNYNPLATSSGGFCCLDNCLTVYLYDVFGDGWNGAEYTIRDWNNEIRQHGTLYSGAYGTDLSCLPDGCYTIDVTGGSFPSEVSWYLIGSTVYIYGAGTSSDSFTVGTGSPGCTQPYASNYNVDATCDDGTCVFSCDADLNNDGTVNVTDLLLFMSQFGVNC